jgi:hypothetical protein
MNIRLIAAVLLLSLLGLASLSPAAAEQDAAAGFAFQAPAYATTYTFTDPAPINIPGTGEDAGYVLDATTLRPAFCPPACPAASRPAAPPFDNPPLFP